MNKFLKMKIALRHWLLGMATTEPNYYKCVEALDFAHLYHSGLRKDNVTPEFEHQVTIAMYIRSISKCLETPWVTICVAILHDVCEDYDVPYSTIEHLFGSEVARSTEAMTKVYLGIKKTDEQYFSGISQDKHASIIKGGDRIHNLQSMSGVFSDVKQIEYINEARNGILPAIKIAKRNFPRQEMAYENIKLIMESQIQLISNSIQCQVV
jgi:(p)ppGpp synthase/HD superfamily hydrolase